MTRTKRLPDRMVDAVAEAAREYHDVLLNHGQATALLLADAELRKDARSGDLDTWGRETLSAALVRAVLAGVSKAGDEALGRNRDGEPYVDWHWPMNGSGDRYKREFFRAFGREAVQCGYRLGRSWRPVILWLEKRRRSRGA